MTKFQKGNLSHGEFFTLQRVTVAVEEARRIDRWSAERAELGNNTTPLVCVPGGPEKQYMWGRTWLPQTPPSKINKTNLSLYFGNFEVSALKGIFYLVTESDAARKQLPGFPKPPFERSPFSFFFAFSWLSKSLLSHCSCQLTVSVVTFCHISFFGGETFDKLKDVICWRSSGYRDSAVQQKLRGSLMWMRTSVLIQSWRSLWIMNELARLTWFPRRLFALHSQVWGGGKTHTLWNAWPEVCRHYWTFFVITFNADYEVYDQHLLALNFKKISSAADLIGLSIPICTRMFWSKPLCAYILSTGMRLFLETKLQTNSIKAAV